MKLIKIIDYLNDDTKSKSNVLKYYFDDGSCMPLDLQEPNQD